MANIPLTAKPLDHITMATTANEKLANALQQAAAKAVNNIIQGKLLTERERNTLVKAGFLKPVLRGWYMLDADVNAKSAGESALWFDSIWGFISQYLQQLFANDYWLSPGSSLDLLTASNALPKQIIIYAQTTPRMIKLPHDMGLLIIKAAKAPYKVTQKDHVNVMSIESVLADITPSAWKNNSLSMQLAITMADISELAGAFEHSKNAAAMGRVLGALQSLGREDDYQILKRIIDSLGFTLPNQHNPFAHDIVYITANRHEYAAAQRIRVLWQSMRTTVASAFNNTQREFDFMSRPLEDTFAEMEELYVQDAYHSLSIEGYRVTTQLVDRVRAGDWDPNTLVKDQQARDALAARGYYEAFEAVKSSLKAVHSGQIKQLSSAVALGITHWYTALFQPCVNVGLIEAKDIAGYRKGPVHIRSSRHAPPTDIYLSDCMDALKALIDAEPDYAVKAVLGHLFLGYIHPFPDGNGRSARFLMNFLFTLGGYRWTIVRLEDRQHYLDSLEQASIEHHTSAFAEFIRMSMVKTKVEIK